MPRWQRTFHFNSNYCMHTIIKIALVLGLLFVVWSLFVGAIKLALLIVMLVVVLGIVNNFLGSSDEP